MRETLLHVLVVSGGGYQGLAVIRGLRKSAFVRIVLADCYLNNTSRHLCDAFRHVPPIADAERFVTAILAICHEEQVRLVIPSTELELELLAQNRPMFLEHGIEVAVSDASFIATVCNKLLLHTFLHNAGIPVLPLYNPPFEEISSPLLGKPLKSWGGRDFVVVRNLEDLATITPNDYIWVPFHEHFEEYSVDFSIDAQGHSTEWFIRKRLRSFSGLCSVGERVSDPVVDIYTRTAIDLFKRHGGRGIFNIQFLKTEDIYCLSDVNPRVGTSSVFSLDLGVNLSLFLCASLNEDVRRELDQMPSGGSSHRTMIRILEETWLDDTHFEDIKAVVFDLDDVLCNQKQWIYAKLKELHGECKHFLPDRYSFLLAAMRNIEEGNRSYPFDALAREFNFDDARVREMVERYRAIRPCSTLYADVLPTLYELRKRGYRLAILTDNPPESQQQKIAACDLTTWFDAIIYSREIGSEKPSTAPFLAVSAALALPVNQLVMVGDNLYRDVIGAIRAGYGGTFFLRRSEALLNTAPGIFAELVGETDNWVQVFSLTDMLVYLSGNSTAS